MLKCHWNDVIKLNQRFHSHSAEWIIAFLDFSWFLVNLSNFIYSNWIECVGVCSMHFKIQHLWISFLFHCKMNLKSQSFQFVGTKATLSCLTKINKWIECREKKKISLESLNFCFEQRDLLIFFILCWRQKSCKFLQ